MTTYQSAAQFRQNLFSNQSFRQDSPMALSFKRVITGKAGKRARKE